MTVVSTVLPTRLIRLQLGQETSWGTVAAATSILSGLQALPTITPTVKSTIFDEQRGSLVPSYSQAQVQLGASFDLKGYVTFEDILYLLSGVYGLPTPSALGVTKNISAVSQAGTKTISANSLASPTVVQTSAPHGLVNGEYVTISGSNSTPLIDGIYPITYVDTTHFSIPVNCSVAGTAGTVTTPSIVQTSATHGLTTGTRVIINGSNSTPAVDGVWTVAVTDTTHFAIDAFCSVAGTTAGTVGNPASWTYTPPSTAVFTPVSYTMELGNLSDATATQLVGGLFQDWSITGTQGKELDFTAKGFGKSVNFGVTPTASLSYRTTEIALMPEMVATMDAAGTSPTTAVANVVSFTLSGNSGLAPFYAAGSLKPTTYTHAKQQLGLKIGIAYSSTVEAALASNLLAGKPAVFRLLTTSGNSAIEMDFCGALKADPVFYGDSQAAQLIELDMDAVYDPTLAMYSKFVVSNAVATLP